MSYTVLFDPLAIMDIQDIINYYDQQEIGLGRKFEQTLDHHILSIKKNPFYKIRYDKVHCLPIKKYPYMIHFTLNESESKIVVRAVFHTSIDPERWQKR